MRSYAKPSVATMKLKMLVSRKVNSVPVEVGDVLTVQQPLAGLLVGNQLAEEVTEKPAAKSKKKAD